MDEANDVRVCSNCGYEFEWDGTTVNAVDPRWQILCPACRRTMRACACCGRMDWQYDLWGAPEGSVCRECLQERYRQCMSCGNWRRDGHVDAGRFYCNETCYRNANRPVHSYDYRPDPIFHGAPEDGLFLGVELEFETPEKDDTAWELFSNYSDAETLFYLEYDSTVPNGFELVSHPCSLAYHQDSFGWPRILRYLKSVGCQSFHAKDSCGIHVHVSRAAFSNGEQVRLTYFMNRHRQNWETLAQRTSNQWSAFKDKPLSDDAINGDDRYEVVNCLNDDTLEFRMFKGTLRLESFMAVLELTETICRFIMSYNNTDIVNDQVAWDDFMTFARASGHKYLDAYLTRKGF